ncbi:ccz-1, partial [Pristionchus pacificus]
SVHMMHSSPMYFIGPGQTTGGLRGCQNRLTDIMDCFFIAHPKSGGKEGEESNRIMYYYPKTDSIDKQTEITGFAEAVVNFTDNFVSVPTADKSKLTEEIPFRDVVTAKTVHVYIMVEEAQFMIGLIMNKKAAQDMDYTLFSPSLRAILIKAHTMFKLFFGNFTEFHKNDVTQFKDRIEYFFSRYLSVLRVYNMPLLDYFSGVIFLRLEDSALFCDIDAFTTELTEQIPAVDKLIFLYQESLLYYTVPKKDLPALFHYLSHNLLPMSLRTELEPSSVLSRPTGHQGKFVTGPREYSTDEPIDGKDALPTVYLSEDEESQTLNKYHLVAYRSLNATVCMFVKGDVTVSRHLMRDIEGCLGTELPHLASSIAEATNKHQSEGTRSDMDFHYIYFNPSSLSLRTTFLDVCTAGGPPPIPPNIHKVACTSFEKLMDEKEEFGECCVKSESDWWIFLKKANGRSLILFLPPSSVNAFTEIHIKVQSIIKTYFQSIFLI